MGSIKRRTSKRVVRKTEENITGENKVEHSKKVDKVVEHLKGVEQ